MKKSEYRQRREKIIEMFDPKQFHHFDTKLRVVNARMTHLNTLHLLYLKSRKCRSIKQIIIDWVKGE